MIETQDPPQGHEAIRRVVLPNPPIPEFRCPECNLFIARAFIVGTFRCRRCKTELRIGFVIDAQSRP